MSQTDTPSAGLTRRSLLTGTARAAGAAALLTAARSALPGGGAWAAAAPEVTGATLGFIALTDSAPLIVAKVKGLFAKYGMPDVNVVKQASWGTTRDNLELGGGAGGIDGAHILTPMPYLMSTGKVTKNNQPLPMQILARLNTNGQCISVANRYKELGITTKAMSNAPSPSPAARMICGCATGWRPTALTRTRMSPPSWCRRRRWSPI